jgi:putative alpha-1,2-mannosidase
VTAPACLEVRKTTTTRCPVCRRACPGEVVRGGGRSGIWLRRTCVDHGAVEVRIATSHISFEQALLNLQNETSGGFDAVRARTAAAWEENLGRIEIEAEPEEMKTFYSCL